MAQLYGASGIILSMRLVRVPTSARPAHTHRSGQTLRIASLSSLLAMVVLFQLLRPLPEPTVSLALPRIAAPTAATIGWPEQGQAAVHAEGYGMLATYGDQQPLATASIAKVITALCIVEKYPLALGEAGPLIPIGPVDVSFYQQQVEQNGSRLPVYEGMKLSEYQALQALLIPSANNIADTLALWGFKSSSAYQAYANDYVLRHGLVHTHVGSDASGFDPSTTSTAEDLARLGQIAEQNPVLMEIASQESAVFPYAGEMKNYNSALGTYGITGLKTGNNDQNPGGLLFTAKIPLGGDTIDVSGAVVGANSLGEAIAQSQELVKSLPANFSKEIYLQPGQRVGTLTTKWGANTPIVSASELAITRWRSQPMATHETVRKPVNWRSGENIGTASLQSGETRANATLKLEHTIKGPSLWWRLSRWR